MKNKNRKIKKKENRRTRTWSSFPIKETQNPSGLYLNQQQQQLQQQQRKKADYQSSNQSIG